MSNKPPRRSKRGSPKRRSVSPRRTCTQQGAALNRTLSFQAALEQLAEIFMQAVGVEACCISTVDAAADEVRVMVDRDPDPAGRGLASGTLGKLSNQPYLVPTAE